MRHHILVRMNNNIKDDKGKESNIQAISKSITRPLEDVAECLYHLFDEISCSDIIQDLIGKKQLTKDNLNLYLIILKTYKTEKYFSATDLIKYLTKKYGYKRKKAEKLPEARFLKLGPKDLRANIKKLRENQLILDVATGKQGRKKTYNTREILPTRFNIIFGRRYVEPSQDVHLIFDLKTPENFLFSDEQMINFLENYLFLDKISLLSQKDIDEIEKDIEGADYKGMRRGIGDLLKRLGISPNSLIHYFNYTELVDVESIKGYQIELLKKHNQDGLANDLYMDGEMREHLAKYREALSKDFKRRMEEIENERAKPKGDAQK